MRWIRNNYVALLALFVALGGTSYAVVKAPKNSVTSKSIKRGAVKSADLKDDGVMGADVDEASLDFGGLPELVGPRGEQGPRGNRGAVGPTFATTQPNNNPAPPATPDTMAVNGQYSHSFVTPTSGRLLVFASLSRLGVNCAVGSGNAFLYLDGVGVPGSGQGKPTIANADPFAAFALTGVVPAGQHTLTIALDCPDGAKTGDTGSADGDLGAIMIGS